MNFKPTLLKSIISIIGGLLIGLFINGKTQTAWNEKLYLNYTDFIYLIGMVLISVIILYVIYSFIQKKK